MTDEQWERNQAAWRRRFVTLELKESIDTDPISVMWSDPKLRDYAACLVIQICKLFADTCSELYERYLSELEALLLTDYCNGEEITPSSQASYNQATSPTWAESKPNAFNVLMGKPVNNVPTRNPFAKSIVNPTPMKKCDHGKQLFCGVCGVVQ